MQVKNGVRRVNYGRVHEWLFITQFLSLKTQKGWAPLKYKLFGLLF